MKKDEGSKQDERQSRNETTEIKMIQRGGRRSGGGWSAGTKEPGKSLRSEAAAIKRSKRLAEGWGGLKQVEDEVPKKRQTKRAKLKRLGERCLVGDAKKDKARTAKSTKEARKRALGKRLAGYAYGEDLPRPGTDTRGKRYRGFVCVPVYQWVSTLSANPPAKRIL